MNSGDRASRLEVTQAGPADLSVVTQILEEASAWLHGRGIDQWPKQFSADWIGPPLERGETWLANIGGVVVGTLTLTTSDPAWPAEPLAAAAYTASPCADRLPASGTTSWHGRRPKHTDGGTLGFGWTVCRPIFGSGATTPRRASSHSGEAMVHGTKVALSETSHVTEVEQRPPSTPTTGQAPENVDPNR